MIFKLGSDFTSDPNKLIINLFDEYTIISYIKSGKEIDYQHSHQFLLHIYAHLPLEMFDAMYLQLLG